MRDPSTYRSAKKKAAKAAGLEWKRLNRTALQKGDSHVVVIPGSPLDKAVFHKTDPDSPPVFTEGGRERMAAVAEASKERLWGVAYRGRDGLLYVDGPKGSHMDLRKAHRIYEHDTDYEAGFLTTENSFVTRAEAKVVAIESGQVGPWLARIGRELLSSDVHWERNTTFNDIPSTEGHSAPLPVEATNNRLNLEEGK